ncbi:thiol-disulfide oxidoreductase DCC family protein [Spongiimicrobium salis]|uniref:thiol-disulfide oxidoreductase DCC family protein n=1 Tax=Spongiimicrobium salis TaxID=1667022 RepID=UPI00374CA654
MSKLNKKIILFDGVCNLCQSSVQFVIKRDKKNIFQFAALQSDFGRSLAQKLNLDISKVDSIVLVDEERKRHWIKSGAALRIAQNLGGAYPLLSVFLIVPGFLRNMVYDYIADNRYKWYGKQEECMIPTPELRSKFLD